MQDIAIIFKYSVVYTSLLVIPITILLNSAPIIFGQNSEIPTISTRNHYDIEDGTPKPNSAPYAIIDPTNKLSTCPPELVICTRGMGWQ